MQVKDNPTAKESFQSELEVEAIDFFVRMMSIMGLPRSVGEIYGLLYFSEMPYPALPMHYYFQEQELSPF